MVSHLAERYGTAAQAMLVAAGAAHDVVLRLEVPGDRATADAIYKSTRLDEVMATGWPAVEQAAFLEQQAQAQYSHYNQHYRPVSDFWFLERANEVIGRLYLFPGHQDVRIVDIALLPLWRARGIGGALIRAVTAIASAAGRTASIHVEFNNLARGLYQRLGFVTVEDHGPYSLMVFSPPGLAGHTSPDGDLR